MFPTGRACARRILPKMVSDCQPVRRVDTDLGICGSAVVRVGVHAGSAACGSGCKRVGVSAGRGICGAVSPDRCGDGRNSNGRSKSLTAAGLLSVLRRIAGRFLLPPLRAPAGCNAGSCSRRAARRGDAARWPDDCRRGSSASPATSGLSDRPACRPSRFDYAGAACILRAIGRGANRNGLVREPDIHPQDARERDANWPLWLRPGSRTCLDGATPSGTDAHFPTTVLSTRLPPRLRLPTSFAQAQSGIALSN